MINFQAELAALIQRLNIIKSQGAIKNAVIGDSNIRLYAQWGGCLKEPLLFQTFSSPSYWPSFLDLIVGLCNLSKLSTTWKSIVSSSLSFKIIISLESTCASQVPCLLLKSTHVVQTQGAWSHYSISFLRNVSPSINRFLLKLVLQFG